MGFGFDDLVPTTPGVGQASLDVVNNQYKAAIDRLTLENALLKQGQAERADMVDQSRLPKKLAIEDILDAQKINVLGGKPIHTDDPDWLQSVSPVSNAQVDIDKAERAGAVAAERTRTTQQHQDDRSAAAQSAERNRLIFKEASDKLKKMTEDNRTVSIKSSPKSKERVVLEYRAIEEIGDPTIRMAAYNRFAPILAEANIPRPSRSPQSSQAPAAAPQAGAPQKAAKAPLGMDDLSPKDQKIQNALDAESARDGSYEIQVGELRDMGVAEKDLMPDQSAQYRAALAKDLGKAADKVGLTDTANALASAGKGLKQIFTGSPKPAAKVELKVVNGVTYKRANGVWVKQ